MAKIKIVVNVPNDDCRNCTYYRHTSFEHSYQSYEEHHRCGLFGNVELDYQAGKYQRCIACQSCEVEVQE